MCVCVFFFYVRVCVCVGASLPPCQMLNDDGVKVSEAHAYVHGQGWAEVVPVQTQVPVEGGTPHRQLLTLSDKPVASVSEHPLTPARGFSNYPYCINASCFLLHG